MYLVEHGKLPLVHANADLQFTANGTTRLSRPPLTYIVAAFVYRWSPEWFGDKQFRLRLGSVLLGTMVVALTFVALFMISGRCIVALAAAVIVAAWPRFMFLAATNNDDIGAILSATCLFTLLLRGLYHKLSWALVFALAAALGLLVISKFTAWLVLPWMLLAFGFVAFSARPRIRLKESLKPSMPVLLTAILTFFICGGWWLLFNMFHYGVTDPTGLQNASHVQAALLDAQSSMPPNRKGYATDGVSLIQLLANYDGFLNTTLLSVVGYLPWLQQSISPLLVAFYGLLMVAAMGSGLYAMRTVNFTAGDVSRSEPRSNILLARLAVIVLLMVCAQTVFYIHHIFLRDIQVDGRYLLPVMLPLLWLLMYRALSILGPNISVNFYGRQLDGVATVCGVSLVALLLFSWQNYHYHLRPSMVSLPHYIAVSPSAGVFDKARLNDTVVENLHVGRSERAVILEKQAPGTAWIQFDQKFCADLPLNAILRMTVTSPQFGRLQVQSDWPGHHRFSEVQSQRFQRGRQQLSFPLAGKRCQAMRLVLPPGTLLLEIQELQVEALQINRFGRPSGSAIR